MLSLLRGHFYPLLELHLSGPLDQASALQLRLLPPLLPGMSRPLPGPAPAGGGGGGEAAPAAAAAVLPCSVRRLCEELAKGEATDGQGRGRA